MRITLCDKCNSAVEPFKLEAKADLRDGYTRRYGIQVNDHTASDAGIDPSDLCIRCVLGLLEQTIAACRAEADKEEEYPEEPPFDEEKLWETHLDYLSSKAGDDLEENR
jgi:hypothetical protein